MELLVEEGLIDDGVVGAEDLSADPGGTLRTLERNLLQDEGVGADEDADKAGAIKCAQLLPGAFVVRAPKGVCLDEGRWDFQALGNLNQLKEKVEVLKRLTTREMYPLIDTDLARKGVAAVHQPGKLRENDLCVFHRDPIRIPFGRARVHAVFAAVGAFVGEKDPGRKGLRDSYFVFVRCKRDVF